MNTNKIKGNNIYCPLPENENTSNSPSGKFNIQLTSYTCFSIKCPIRKEKPKGTISSIDFLKYLTDSSFIKCNQRYKTFNLFIFV